MIKSAEIQQPYPIGHKGPPIHVLKVVIFKVLNGIYIQPKFLCHIYFEIFSAQTHALSHHINLNKHPFSSASNNTLVERIWLKLFKKQSILLRVIEKKLKCMEWFQYHICDMHFGTVKDELIYGCSA